MNDLLYLLAPPVIAFVLFGLQWLLWGRDEAGGKDTVVVQYAPPEGLGVMECGVLYDDVLNTSDVASEVLDLSFKGIIEIKDQAFILKKDFNSPEYQQLSDGQKILLSLLFGTDPAQTLYFQQKDFIESLKWLPVTSSVAHQYLYRSYLKKLASKMDELKLMMYEVLTQKGYFNISPHEQRKPYYVAGAFLFAGPLTFNLFSLIDESGGKFMIPWPLVIGIMLAGYIISVFAGFMARKTVQGREMRAAVLGLKEFIQTAEADRIRFVLENDIQAYRKILPYAALFQSLEKWIEPLQTLQEGLAGAELVSIRASVSALDVESAMTERKKWPQALFSLFYYGFQLYVKLTSGMGFRKRRYWDRDRSAFDE